MFFRYSSRFIALGLRKYRPRADPRAEASTAVSGGVSTTTPEPQSGGARSPPRSTTPGRRRSGLNPRRRTGSWTHRDPGMPTTGSVPSPGDSATPGRQVQRRGALRRRPSVRPRQARFILPVDDCFTSVRGSVACRGSSPPPSWWYSWMVARMAERISSERSTFLHVRVQRICILISSNPRMSSSSR